MAPAVPLPINVACRAHKTEMVMVGLLVISVPTSSYSQVAHQSKHRHNQEHLRHRRNRWHLLQHSLWRQSLRNRKSRGRNRRHLGQHHQHLHYQIKRSQNLRTTASARTGDTSAYVVRAGSA